MAWVLAETVSESFEIGTTGQTFTRTASYINGSSSVWNPTFTELGGGFYRYSYTPAVAGSFEWVGTATNGTPVSINFDVEANAVTPVVVVSAASTGALTTTRAELRRRIAERFEDYEPLVATSAGTTSTIKDAYHISGANEHFNGRDLICTSGANNGLRRRVTDTTIGSSQISLSAPVLTAATAQDDTFDTFNKIGRGFRAEQYDRAINNAINDAWPTAAIAIEASIVADFDATSGEITLPAEVVQVDRLETEDSDGRWYEVPKANHAGGDGWWAVKSSGELRLYGNRAWGAHTRSLKVYGFGRHPTLTSDTDTCAINPKFVVAHAAYHLATGAVSKEEHSIRVNIFRDEMERYRVAIVTARGASVSNVRAA